MSALTYFAVGQAIVIVALLRWVVSLLDQLESERQRIALLRRLR